MAPRLKLFYSLVLITVNVYSATIDSDSYLSAYKLTHDLNNHFENRPTGEKVVYVDANTDQHIDVHPVYVQKSHDDHTHTQDLIDEHFHEVNAEHAQHADHLDVEHHYQPEYHEHYIDVSGANSAGNDGLSGLGSYGTPPVSSYGPPAAGVPIPEVGYPTASPVQTYGPPVPVSFPKKMPVYGPPSPVYGPPSPVYGPPTHHIGVYGPPHHKLPPLVAHEYYEPEPPSIIPDFLHNLVTPHAFLGILDKIKWFKLDLFTIGKLILKFFIFKKFLAFFTILFLLLIIPSLKHKGKESVGMMTAMVDKFGQSDDDDDDEEDDDNHNKRKKKRKGKMLIDKATESLNALTSHVLESIENFEQKFNKNQTQTKLPSTIVATDLNQLSNSQKSECGANNTSIYCKSQSVIEKIKTIMPARDEETKKTTNTTKTSTTTTTTKPTVNRVVNLTSKSQLRPVNSKNTSKTNSTISKIKK